MVVVVHDDGSDGAVAVVGFVSVRHGFCHSLLPRQRNLLIK